MKKGKKSPILGGGDGKNRTEHTALIVCREQGSRRRQCGDSELAGYNSTTVYGGGEEKTGRTGGAQQRPGTEGSGGKRGGRQAGCGGSREGNWPGRVPGIGEAGIQE